MENSTYRIFTLNRTYRISIEKSISDMGNHYFTRSEDIEDCHAKALMLQIICSIMSEGGIFFEDCIKYKPYKSICKQIFSTPVRVYKAAGLYFYFLFPEKEDMPEEYKEKIQKALINTFNYDKYDIKKIKQLQEKLADSANPDEFTLGLSIYTFMFGNSNIKPINLALMYNFLYNSYNRFLENYERYVRFRETA